MVETPIFLPGATANSPIEQTPFFSVLWVPPGFQQQPPAPSVGQPHFWVPGLNWEAAPGRWTMRPSPSGSVTNPLPSGHVGCSTHSLSQSAADIPSCSPGPGFTRQEWLCFAREQRACVFLFRLFAQVAFQNCWLDPEPRWHPGSHGEWPQAGCPLLPNTPRTKHSDMCCMKTGCCIAPRAQCQDGGSPLTCHLPPLFSRSEGPQYSLRTFLEPLVVGKLVASCHVL